jgi:hypothetical protein
MLKWKRRPSPGNTTRGAGDTPAKLPSARRENYSFRVREDLPVTLDDRGHARFTAMLYVPKAETSLDYNVRVDITLRGGQPVARIVSMQRVKAK